VTVTVLDTEAHLIAALERHGYARQDRPPFYRHLSRSLADLPQPVLPEGYRARPVRGEEDLAGRVAVHRAAWPPPGHRGQLPQRDGRVALSSGPDRVVEAPDGRLVANCLIWFDERNGVGELEPVGTNPEFRRRGLGRGVCLAAMHALRRAGARQAVVYAVQGHPDHPAPIPLYQGLGFYPHTRALTFAKQAEVA
jgi:GNAT superfamily N-acetyltransferase